MISILLPCYKAEKLLPEVFMKGLIKNTKTDVELVLYDNGGNGEACTNVLIDGANNKIPSNIKVVLRLSGGKNIGLNAGLNECAKVATGDYFYLPHTDMVLMPNWDTTLLEEAKKHAPRTFLFCSRSIEKNSHIPTQLLKDFGTSLDTFKEKELYEFFQTYNDKSIRTSYRMPFFLHRNLWEKMNGVDNSFFSYATDNDLFFSAYDVGVRKFWMIYSSVVYHLSGQSNKEQKVDKDDELPYLKLCEKWGKYNVSMNIDKSEQNLIPWGLKIK